MKCLDEKIGAQITLYALGALDAGGAKAFEEHLWDCACCAERWYEMAPFLEELSQDRPAYRERLHAALVGAEARRPPRGAASAGGGILSWLRPRRTAWHMAAILLLVAGLSLSLFYYYEGRDPALNPITPGERAPLRLIEPLGPLDRRPEAFRWDPVPRARQYRVTLREGADGAIIFEEKIDEPIWRPMDEVLGSLRPGVSYYWMVTAADETGQLLGKAEGSFQIR